MPASEFEKKLIVLDEEIGGKTSALDSLKHQEADTDAWIVSLEKTIDIIREEHTETGRKLDARQNEYQLTKSLVENLEGFPETIKFWKESGLDS